MQTPITDPQMAAHQPEITARLLTDVDPVSEDAVYLRMLANLGIRRELIEVFSVGAYRYSKLDDALAQVRRASK